MAPERTAAANGEDFEKRTLYAVADRTRARYVGSGLSNSYMPYDVGEIMCPGRGFARCEIVVV